MLRGPSPARTPNMGIMEAKMMLSQKVFTGPGSCRAVPFFGGKESDIKHHQKNNCLRPSFTRRCHAGAFAKAPRTKPLGPHWQLETSKKTLTCPTHDFPSRPSPPQKNKQPAPPPTPNSTENWSSSLDRFKQTTCNDEAPRTPDRISCCAKACWAKHPNSPHDHGNVNVGSQQEEEPWSAQANGTTRDPMTSASLFLANS